MLILKIVYTEVGPHNYMLILKIVYTEVGPHIIQTYKN